MKIAQSEPFRTTRELITFINDNGIQKEDIVQIITLKDQMFLIYYK